ncbi:MAG: aspartate/glutamate racemase family protein [Bacillota bacterium]
MNKIGILGGMGWHSTSIYYNKLNSYINKKNKKEVTPEIIIYSVNFKKILKYQNEENWKKVTEILIPKAVLIEKMGADILVITSNTVHKIVDDLQNNISIPIVSIVDVVGKALKNSWCKKSGLLATKYLINDGFYQKILENEYNQKIVLPSPSEIEELNNIIVNELVDNEINMGSKFYINSIIDNLLHKDIDSLILGCTELGSIIDNIPSHEVKIINSLELHIQEIVNLVFRKNL